MYDIRVGHEVSQLIHQTLSISPISCAVADLWYYPSNTHYSSQCGGLLKIGHFLRFINFYYMLCIATFLLCQMCVDMSENNFIE